ncbi:RNA-binding protein 5-B-like [Sinocyclocheilus rhinocerous]|uniref:RNA-binding protein 5-B-like n=1 Tax=Sinocyclocheilus rhinocerous TaxID=307959 RepID=UPI0007B97443|nr:PREDICTED: RNA-binding protein 5-B-like [Sinocyclocheilus rhinocerous]
MGASWTQSWKEEFKVHKSHLLTSKPELLLQLRMFYAALHHQLVYLTHLNSSFFSAISHTATATSQENQATVPDTSSYQYDESSGYYYDPSTGLYYDPNTHYYYNSQTQQYLYWDGEKQAYVPAVDANNAAQSAAASMSTPQKERKEKPKSKTAQQAQLRMRGAGLGTKGSNYSLSASDTHLYLTL